MSGVRCRVEDRREAGARQQLGRRGACCSESPAPLPTLETLTPGTRHLKPVLPGANRCLQEGRIAEGRCQGSGVGCPGGDRREAGARQQLRRRGACCSESPAPLPTLEHLTPGTRHLTPVLPAPGVGHLKAVAAAAPLRRNTDQTEVADTALFLCSHLSRGITGEVIFVDSGYHIMGMLHSLEE